jgi:hypothetical protein
MKLAIAGLDYNGQAAHHSGTEAGGIRNCCATLLTALVKQQYGKNQGYNLILPVLRKIPQESVLYLCTALAEQGYGIKEITELAIAEFDKACSKTSLHLLKFVTTHRSMQSILTSKLALFSLLFKYNQGYDAAIQTIQERIQESQRFGYEDQDTQKIITYLYVTTLLNLLITHNQKLADVIRIATTIMHEIENLLTKQDAVLQQPAEKTEEFIKNVLDAAQKAQAAQEETKTSAASSTSSAAKGGKEGKEEKQFETKEEKKQ